MVNLGRKRGGVRTSATRLVQKLEDIADDANLSRANKIHELQRKVEELNKRLATLTDLDEQILAATPDDDVEQELNDTDLANSVYRDARDNADFIISTLVKEETDAAIPVPNPNPPPAPPQTRATNRPKITLPRFNGDILQWSAFWQVFDAEIHSDDTTADINKFNYLIGQLEPEVKATVAGLIPSSENYPTLVQLLEERYGSKPKIIAAYMRALYNLLKPDGTLASLRNFYDNLESYVRGLSALGKDSDAYGDLLVCILLDKFPVDLRKSLARQHDQEEWTLDQLRAAIKSEIRVLEAGQITTISKTKLTATVLSTFASSATAIKKKPIACSFCNGGHYSGQCTVHASGNARMKVAIQKRLCTNCLSGDHQKKECKSRNRCRILGCAAEHHTSLHGGSSTDGSSESSSNVATVATNHISTVVSALSNGNGRELNVLNATATSPFVFLKTAIVVVRSRQYFSKANVLLDEGSQRTFISRRLATDLHLQPVAHERLLLSGFAGESAGPQVYEITELTIDDQKSNSITLRAIIVGKTVNALDDSARRVTTLSHLRSLNLAHPATNKKSFPVDILIGADLYWNIVGDKRPIRGPGPTAVASRIGYLMSGPCEQVQVAQPNRRSAIDVAAMDEDMSKLWSLEAVGISYNNENLKEAVDYAASPSSTKTASTSQGFPRRMDHSELASNFAMVRNMTRATVQRLARDPKLLSHLDSLIQHQVQRGFIELVPNTELSRSCHYIPYHLVRKESSTTPIRIVYNCSCRGWNGVSLNDCMEAGAPLQNDQLHILLRFRTHAVGIVADVEKAFHHIELDPNDRDFLRWLWLENPKDPESKLVAYRFKVVPFGAKASPFILNATVIKHLEKETSSVARDMQRSVYVDNIITGCNSKTEAVEYYENANEIMSRANLPLQAWGFSDASIEVQLQADQRLDTASISKILGLQWNRKEDVISVQQVRLSQPQLLTATKRDVLRGVASVYDPFGFFAPLSVKGKILLQDLHIEKQGFDQPMNQVHFERWILIVKEIEIAIENQLMTVPRSYFGGVETVRELHVFCDASRRAYGAVAYFLNKNSTSFVMSKNRIAPLKDVNREERELTIPETELMAYLIGTLIAETIIVAMEALGIKLQVFMWGDNQVAHFWISKADGHPRQFITNRVKKIRDFNSRRAATWRFVPTDQNPADLLSRGIPLAEFKTSNLWKNGPIWLSNRKEWPNWSVSQFTTTLALHAAPQPSREPPAFGDIASVVDVKKYRWTVLLRMTALFVRLLDNLKLRDPTRVSWNRQPLIASELQYAENMLIRSAQHRHLGLELAYLKSKKKVSRPALVSQLDLFLDQEGIIRCGGRLQNALICESAKHPIFIPKESDLARLIIVNIHEQAFHFGVEATVSHIRQRYWIPAIRQQVNSVYSKCVKCRKDCGPAYRAPNPAPLPAIRIQETYPFALTGVDYTGAIPIRGKSKDDDLSAYILLMTCGVTRAVHLEVVETMSTKGFMDAFRRFTGHHPLPRIL